MKSKISFVSMSIRSKIILIIMLGLLIIGFSRDMICEYLYIEYSEGLQTIFSELETENIKSDQYENNFIKLFSSEKKMNEFKRLRIYVYMSSILNTLNPYSIARTFKLKDSYIEDIFDSMKDWEKKTIEEKRNEISTFNFLVFEVDIAYLRDSFEYSYCFKKYLTK